MRDYVFDLRRVDSLNAWWDLYTAVVGGSGSEWFGRNRDAYRDSLAGGPGCPVLPCRFVFEHVGALLDRDLAAMTIRELELNLPRVHPTAVEHIRWQIELLRYGNGETVLHWILDPAIRTNNIEVVLRAGA